MVSFSSLKGKSRFSVNRKEEINMYKKSKLVRIAIPSLLLLGLMMIGSIRGFSREKSETIDATAWGTSTQLGHNIDITLIIYEFSTPKDREFQTRPRATLLSPLMDRRTVETMGACLEHTLPRIPLA